MDDVPTETSSAGITPPPSQMQDPCDEFLHITVNKVWQDLYNIEHLRPNSITLTLWRKWTDGNGVEQTEAVQGYDPFVWTPDDSSDSTWQTVWNDLPAYKSETITAEDGTETTNILQRQKYPITSQRSHMVTAMNLPSRSRTVISVYCRIPADTDLI